MTAQFNLFAPEVHEDPYPVYAELRRLPGLTQVEPGGLWAVSRYADVQQALKNPQVFSSSGFRVALQPEWLGRPNPLNESILVKDPPQHTRLRALVTRAFGPTTLTRLEPHIRAYAQQAAARLPIGSPVDFIEHYALQIPANVIGELLGLDPSLHGRFKRWSDDITSTSSVPPDNHAWQAQVRSTYNEMEEYLASIIAQRRRQPSDDMVSDLLTARVDGEALTNNDLMGFLVLLLVAGLETTVHLIAHSGLMLAKRPDLMERLRADRSKIPAFIEEMLRYESPAQGVLRLTMAETELSGTRLPAFTPVLLLLASAARDEKQFPDSDRFDIDRPGPQNIPFGHGIHFCLGAPLARMEARIALDVLLDRCGGLTRDAAPVQWNQSIIVRGPTVLPLILQPARG
jgi:cytochrome P450